MKMLNPKTPLLINNKPIERVEEFKFLGYRVDEHLSWKAHIVYISNKVSKMIGLFTKLRKILNVNTLRNLYFTFVYPYLNSGIGSWGSAAAIHIKILEVCQQKSYQNNNFITKINTFKTVV